MDFTKKELIQYKHYLKTKRTPFAKGYLPDLTKPDKYGKIKLEYDLKFERFVSLVDMIENAEERNILINDTTDSIEKYIKKAGTTNYREYFISLKNRMLDLKTVPSQQNQFSVLEWATIFYYANETKLLPESKAIKNRWEQFMKKHNINTTSDTFKKNYYDAKKRINEKKNYPIDKLNLIIPFIMENYSQAVSKVSKDISFLQNYPLFFSY